MIGSRSRQGNQDESGIFSGTVKLESTQKKIIMRLCQKGMARLKTLPLAKAWTK